MDEKFVRIVAEKYFGEIVVSLGKADAAAENCIYRGVPMKWPIERMAERVAK